MKSLWIVVANAASARIFRRESAVEPLVPVSTLMHEQSRMRAAALTSDRAGSQATDHSYGANRFEPHTSARRKEHQRFAKEIALRLDEGLKTGAYGSLMILAPNPFMGELRAQLSDAVNQRLKVTLNNDLSHVGLAELERRIPGAWAGSL